MIRWIKKWWGRLRQKWKDRWKRFFSIPHLFAKCTVVYCIVYSSLACAFCLWKQGQGIEMEGILAIVLGFFGGELLLLCLKTILKKDSEEEETEVENDVET